MSSRVEMIGALSPVGRWLQNQWIDLAALFTGPFGVTIAVIALIVGVIGIQKSSDDTRRKMILVCVIAVAALCLQLYVWWNAD
jgi:type IV secretory pathway VirB2 component (pilin)